MTSTTLYTKFAHLQIPLEDIVNATNNFDPGNIIGRGGLGLAYKGRLQWSGKLIKVVALRCDRKQGEGDIEFWTEVSALSNLKHPNIVSIIGFCDDKEEKIIITTFSAKGSLKEHLACPEKMEHPNRLDITWTQILKICVGVARAMSYLHHDDERGYGVIHLNINSSTILLNNKWEPMLSGFKVSVKQSLNQMDQAVLSKPIGMLEYMDPAIEKTRGVTQKSDTYSFGVVLFEALCGRKFIQNNGNLLPASIAIHHYQKNKMKDIIHPSLWDQMSPQSLDDYLSVLDSCLKEERADRPNSDSIVKQLENALEFQLRRENLVKKLEHLKIPLTNVQLATNYFSVTHKIESAYDHLLYIAKLHHFDKEQSSSIEGKKKRKHPKGHNRTVVIKRCGSGNDRYKERQFLTELEMLTCVKHRNIVTLLGFCVEGLEMILVIENVSNGYLYKYLGNDNEYKRILTWEKRLKICIDIAHVLNYLHYEMEDKKVIINRDICRYNIMLDENWGAKITYFGDSLFLPPNQEDEALHIPWYGRPSYLDPEHKLTNKLKRESDVYSFGVVLFEILCGRTANDSIYNNRGRKGLASVVRHNFYLKTLEDMIDPIVKEGTSENAGKKKGPYRNSLHTFIKIAHQCIAEAQAQRPTMKVVVKELEKALSFQQESKEYSLANFQMLRMSLEDIKVATKNFHDDNCIGGGSFGKFYKGKVQQGDEFISIVAKRLATRHLQGDRQFLNELQILLEYKHENIIGLIGYCDEMEEKIIVYEYVSRSLDIYLNDASLTWVNRLNICIDVARVLDFLHRGAGMKAEGETPMFWDINVSNILLDDGWKAKVAGFEDSLICPSNQETPNVIYSFGVVLFEILCGRSMKVHKDEGHPLQDFIKNIFKGQHDEMVFDPIKEQIVPKSLRAFKRIAYQCLHDDRKKQPTTKKVLTKLKKALRFQEERRQHSNTNKVVNKLEKLQLTREIPEKKLKHLKIPLADIRSATDDFSKTYLIRSSDNYEWYRAELNIFDIEDLSFEEGGHPNKHNRTLIIKRYLSEHNKYSDCEEEFRTEFVMLSSVKHPNIVTLLGFCVEGSEMIIVTENVSNGYLYKYLGDENQYRRTLTWENRLNICIDVAHALNYLHYDIEGQYMIINSDACSYGIGLDENMSAKITCFENSVFLFPNQEEEALYLTPKGIELYMDPEYKNTGKLKRESDVYSFGVLLLEILCGKSASDRIFKTGCKKGLVPFARQSFRMGTLEDMIDPMIVEETNKYNFVLGIGPNKDSLHTFIEIAHKCVAKSQDRRPTMKVVVKELKKALSFQKNENNLRMSLEDIKRATKNFCEANFIAEGGFGRVFEGKLKHGDGTKTIVAKRLNERSRQGEHEFLNEVQILLEYKHENIIGLVGYCDEKGEKIIVYECASRGSLNRHLNKASLKWEDRLKICIEVASALDFLHGGVGRQAKVIHRDIKTSNILLNHDWKANLADFGLSLKCPLTKETDYVIDLVCGTTGYLDPLYYKLGFLTIESDIYSFGVVLFEILCGRIILDIDKFKSKFEEGQHDEVVFEHIREHIIPKSLTTFEETAYQCLHHEREKRPTTKEVLAQLKKALKFQRMASTMTKFAPLQIPLEDVVKATNNFHVDNIIRYGEYGTAYKGQLLWSRRLVKIFARRFNCNHQEVDLKFLMEITVLSDLKHSNVVSIIGYCDEKYEKIIVTTYEANGSLNQYLSNSDLTWTQRLKICVGVARALSYLHYEKGRDYAILHCNINSDTILLDENWEAKLSGFEISIKQSVYGEDRVVFFEPIETMGYVDPAIEKTGGVTRKSDIYSFGVILFEILSGMKASVENDANTFLASLAKYHDENKTLEDIIHPNLWNQMSPQSLTKYSKVAYSCLREERADRRDMNYIVAKLEKALELQLRHENFGKKMEHLKICLSDIKLATNNFSKTCRIVYTKYLTLYRAELKYFDRESHPSVEEKIKGEPPKKHNTVVIKRYPRGHDMYTEEDFFKEIEMLISVQHPNIVTLLGFCAEDCEMILVIDNVSNGLLGNCFGNATDKRILTWETRLKICIDIAYAVNHLHFEMQEQKMIINRNLMSDRIGLDENWRAKMFEFGHSLFLPPNQVDKGLFCNFVYGIQCSRDPEYERTGMLKRESDVYGFGVVLFEILCGTRADDPIYMKESDKGLAHVARQNIRTGTLENMIDPVLKEKGPNKNSLQTFIEIASQCVAETQNRRPTMKVVVKELEKALFFQENKDHPVI